MTFCGCVNFLLCVIICKADHKDLLRYSHYYWSYGTMMLDSYKVPTFQNNKISHVMFEPPCFFNFSKMYRTTRFKKQEAVNGEPMQLEIFFFGYVRLRHWNPGWKWSSWKMTTTCDLDRRPKLRVTLWLALAEVALLTCTRIQQTASAKTKKGAVRLWHCSRTESGWFITCTHTGCARRRTARWARASCRRSSSAAYRSENELFRSTPRHRSSEVCVSRPIPPWWACSWARGRTPGPRRCSNRRIASKTRRMGRKDYASRRAAPATPPPGCPEARIHSASRPPATAALVRTRVCTFAHLFISHLRFKLERAIKGCVPSLPSLDFGESAGRQWASLKGDTDIIDSI